MNSNHRGSERCPAEAVSLGHRGNHIPYSAKVVLNIYIFVIPAKPESSEIKHLDPALRRGDDLCMASLQDNCFSQCLCASVVKEMDSSQILHDVRPDHVGERQRHFFPGLDEEAVFRVERIDLGMSLSVTRKYS